MRAEGTLTFFLSLGAVATSLFFNWPQVLKFAGARYLKSSTFYPMELKVLTEWLSCRPWKTKLSFPRKTIKNTDFPYLKMHEAYRQNAPVGMARLLFAVAHDSRYLHHAADNNQPLGAVSLGLDTANDAVG